MIGCFRIFVSVARAICQRRLERSGPLNHFPMLPTSPWQPTGVIATIGIRQLTRLLQPEQAGRPCREFDNDNNRIRHSGAIRPARHRRRTIRQQFPHAWARPKTPAGLDQRHMDDRCSWLGLCVMVNLLRLHGSRHCSRGINITVNTLVSSISFCLGWILCNNPLGESGWMNMWPETLGASYIHGAFRHFLGYRLKGSWCFVLVLEYCTAVQYSLGCRPRASKPSEDNLLICYPATTHLRASNSLLSRTGKELTSTVITLT